jgi:hypothetical protein
MIQRYDIRNANNKGSVAEYLTNEQVCEFINNHAKAYNHGVFRTWKSQHNTTFYDVGPVVLEVMPL